MAVKFDYKCMGIDIRSVEHLTQVFNFYFCTTGGPEDGQRVIFSVDLWHPNIAAAERQALDYIFSPEQ